MIPLLPKVDGIDIEAPRNNLTFHIVRKNLSKRNTLAVSIGAQGLKDGKQRLTIHLINDGMVEAQSPGNLMGLSLGHVHDSKHMVQMVIAKPLVLIAPLITISDSDKKEDIGIKGWELVGQVGIKDSNFFFQLLYLPNTLALPLIETVGCGLAAYFQCALSCHNLLKVRGLLGGFSEGMGSFPDTCKGRDIYGICIRSAHMIVELLPQFWSKVSIDQEILCCFKDG